MLLPVTTDESMLPGFVKFIDSTGREVVFNIDTGKEVIENA